MLPVLPEMREELALLPGPVLADGQPSWILHDPARNQFFRVNWFTFEVLSRWSLRQPDLIVRSLHTGTTIRARAADVIAVRDFLVDNQLVRRGGSEDTKAMAQAHGDGRGQLWKQLLHHYLFFRVPLVRPDAWLTRWQRVAGWFGGRSFRGLTALVLVAGLVQGIRHSGAFFSTLVDTFTWQGLWTYGLGLIFVKTLHELGHAFAAKRQGCHVPAMGIAFMVLWPMPYTDTNEAWRLTRRRERLRVACAGIATELTLGAWALFAWAWLPDGPARQIAFVLCTTSLVATLAINASPFMRFDGYFILCDALDMPNLHGRSFALARWWLRELLFAPRAAPPEHFNYRQRAAMIAFALATWIYRLFVFIGIAILVYHFFIKLLGVVLFLVEIVWFVLRPAYMEIKTWFAQWPKWRASRVSRRRMRWSVVVLILAVFLAAWPWPGRVQTKGILRPQNAMSFYAPGDAYLEEVGPPDGAFVPAGTVLARMHSSALTARLQLADLRADLQRRQAEAAEMSPEGLVEWRPGLERAATAASEREHWNTVAARYRPVAPFAGVWRTAHPDLRPGTWVARNEPLGVLIDPAHWVVEAYLDDEQVKAVAAGNPGVFMSERAEGPVYVLELLQVDVDATRLLPDGRLAARHGGTVLTRETSQGHVPEQTAYRVLFAVTSDLSGADNRQMRGHVVIKCEAYSRLTRYVRQAFMVLLRETGF